MRRICLFVIVGLFPCCEEKVGKGVFQQQESLGIVRDPEITEASGLVAGVNNPGMLWTHNDSGGKARLFLIDTTGRTVAKVDLGGVENRDWEDIAIGPGPELGKTYLYVGDIGDNFNTHDGGIIYRVEEPELISGDTVLSSFDIIRFVFEDGPRDSETIMVDPLDGTVYLVTKRERSVGLYQLIIPQVTDIVLTARLVKRLGFSSIVSGDISRDGREILLKDYRRIYYWKREPGEQIGEVLGREPGYTPYIREPQGEAITFNLSGTGFYTVSEASNRITPPHLYFYRRELSNEDAGKTEEENH